jgi:hypothetical protein
MEFRPYPAHRALWAYFSPPGWLCAGRGRVRRFVGVVVVPVPAISLPVLRGRLFGADAVIARPLRKLFPRTVVIARNADKMLCMSTPVAVAHESNGRLLEAAAALLSAAPSKELQTTNLNKALFYLDLYCLRDLGHVVTQNTFMALPEGPVVAKYDKRLIEALQKQGIAEQVKSGRSLLVKLIKMPGALKFLGAREIAIAAQVSLRCANATAREVSDFSHDNPGWQIAFASGLEGGKPAKPINLLIAMQQIVDEDPWLKEPLSPELKSALCAADNGEGESW